uniref:Uncharacterized protein n=1 Tax=Aotus nancymaae TaxID=37293 RepID=A0A2K5DDQ3_AOTNA
LSLPSKQNARQVHFKYSLSRLAVLLVLFDQKIKITVTSFYQNKY